MIQHDHSEKVAGCFRCDLSSDDLNSTIVFLTNLHKATEPGSKSREIALVEFGGGLLAEVDRLRAQRYAALAKIQRLLEGHDRYLPPGVDYDCCSGCNRLANGYVRWPCPLRAALAGPEDRNEP